MNRTYLHDSELSRAHAKLIEAAVTDAPLTELRKASIHYRVAHVNDHRRKCLRAAAQAFHYVGDAIKTRRELHGISFSIRMGPGLRSSLRKKIKAAGGRYSECRGNQNQRRIEVPASHVALVDEIVKEDAVHTVIIHASNTIWNALTKAHGRKRPMRDVYHQRGRYTYRDGKQIAPRALKAPSVYLEPLLTLLGAGS